MFIGRLASCAGAALACMSAVATGCAGNHHTATDQHRFEAVMVERLGATDVQARCITGYVFDAYDPAEIDILAAEGMQALPQARWEPYLNAAIACVTKDQSLGTDR